MGSAEGWVPTPQDLYYNGQNPAAFTINTARAEFQNTRIVMTGEPGNGEINTIQFTKKYNVQSYSKLIFEGKFDSMGVANTYYRTLVICLAGLTGTSSITFSKLDASLTSITLNITNLITINSGAAITTRLKAGSYFTRIRLA